MSADGPGRRGPPELEAVADVPAAFAATVCEAIERRHGRPFTLLLSGGPTARACYGALAELAPGRIDWTRVAVYIGDERFVPPGHRDANQTMMRRVLIDRVAPVADFVPMPTAGTPEAAAAAYDREIAGLLAGEGIDLIHLGLGPDGHTASLFPGSSALEAPPGRWAVSNVDPSGRNPHPRLTLTLSAIAQARLAVFTVDDPATAPALAALRAGEDLPAGRVRAGEVRWLVDAAVLGEAGS